MKWNKMQRVYCPKVQREAPANGTKKGELRCTACGLIHGGLKV